MVIIPPHILHLRDAGTCSPVTTAPPEEGSKSYGGQPCGQTFRGAAGQTEQAAHSSGTWAGSHLSLRVEGIRIVSPIGVIKGFFRVQAFRTTPTRNPREQMIHIPLKTQ
eukprot:gene12579-biopygen18499